MIGCCVLTTPLMGESEQMMLGRTQWTDENTAGSLGEMIRQKRSATKLLLVVTDCKRMQLMTAVVLHFVRRRLKLQWTADFLCYLR